MSLRILMLFILFTTGVMGLSKRSLPLEWPLEFGGDLRFRNHAQQQNNNWDLSQRFRFRLYSSKAVNPYTDLNFGLISGDDNPRSGNQRFQNSFDNPDIRIDHVYVTFSPIPTGKVRLGKLKSFFWHPTDMLFDSDIRREGIETQEYHGDYIRDYYFSTGLYLLDEKSGSNRDPYLAAYQARLDYLTSPKTRTLLGASYYTMINGDDAVLDHSSGTNSLTNGGLTHPYNVIVLGGQFVQKDTLGFKFVTWTFEYAQNLAIESDNKGYTFGVKLGNRSLHSKGQWAVGLSYRRLEQDSFLDIFPDSDAYFGETDTQGAIVEMDYALMSDVVLGMTFYAMDRINRSSDKLQVVQADIKVKF